MVKEGRVIGPDSGSSDHLAHGIHVLMARNYVLNLAEETRKGMDEKARSGAYPSFAPIGYRNADGPDGKRVIVLDREAAPVIVEVFARFSKGGHSIRSLVKELNAEGFRLWGAPLRGSVVH